MRNDNQQQLPMSISHGDTLPASIFNHQNLIVMLQQSAKTNRGIRICDRHNQVNWLSYQDLLVSATKILKGLRYQGLKPQDRVILYCNHPHHFFISLWACWLGGFIPIPLTIELNLTNDPSRGKLYQTWNLCHQPIIITDQANLANSLLKSEAIINIGDLLNNAQDLNYHHSQLDDLALLMFTSGSTGKPKGVMLSVRNLVASVYGMAKVNHLSFEDITLNWMPLEHIASLVMFHLTEVYLGCEQIQVNSELILQNPLEWLNLIDKYRVTATWSPNFAYNLINEKLDQAIQYDWDLSCLQWMGNGAEAVVGKTTARFLALLAPYGLAPDVVSPGYGMSETTSGISHSHEFYAQRKQEFVSVGKPIPGVSLRIVNQEHQVIPEGNVGLLQVKGATVTAGYYGQPELNQEVFIDGWFNTGDLGFIQHGRLVITGRQKDIIVINGNNYYNQDIETIVEAIPGINVSFTAACSVTDQQQQEQIAIFFNTDQEQDQLRALINHIRRLVFTEIGVSPAYIIPVAQQDIPKTEIGKIKRSQLSQRFQAGEFKKLLAEVDNLLQQRNLTQLELPGNEIEQQLVKIWQEVLQQEKIGTQDNFFELGGNSLLLMEVLSRLSATGMEISAINLFQYPSISALANYLGDNHQESFAQQQGIERGRLRYQAGNRNIAIIGMSCRFPGAQNIAQFWSNLCNGIESISFFTAEEMLEAGVSPELINHPDYVNASPILDEIENFDANFWGFTPKEAQLLDPQQRLFLECAWESLEDAGYNPLTYAGDISLYGGAATNTYLLNNIYPNRDRLDEQDNLGVFNLSSMGGFQVSTANDKDYLTTRTSYKLNLTGSSINIQTACSTSLVAVHLACQSLINAECDLALAGAVSVHSPQKMGYLYQEGMILSPDGHCRAFDAAASGTIFGSGAGIVVLKLLDRAIESGDRIYGVIKGSAVNNDGGIKVGYLAPNVDGQTRVIAEALAVANLPPETISYVEAHGTGTKLGDPIEIKALSQSYQQDLQQTGYCALGSVKTNVGHLQMASGIVGLIKTTLCLYHQQIPASLHFNQPNPQIDFDHSPFYLNTKLQDWLVDDYPRRAGVNSLGIGGTNAHLILEEFIPQQSQSTKLLPGYLLTLSAKSEIALQALAQKYQDFLNQNEQISLADVCLTSNVGRHHFDYRCSIVAHKQPELIKQLSQISIAHTQGKQQKIAWLFTGQGSQYLGMAQQLYATCDVFKETCDRCLALCNPEIAAIFHNIELQKLKIQQTEFTQPLLFIIEYSLGKMWLAWGIKPDVMVGHSIGEYVAATLAGIFDLADAIKLVSARGKLMQSLPENGAMLAIFADEAKISHLLNPDLHIAANNGSHLVLSGYKSDIENLIPKLEQLQLKASLLDVAHGFHSPLMQPIVQEFQAIANSISYALPQIPIVSNLTGKLAQETIATADYWVEHILQPVQFAQSIDYLNQAEIDIFLEIGVKPTLKGIIASMLDLPDVLCLHTLNQADHDWVSILETLAKLYTKGINLNWHAITKNYQAQKISLPTYPFQRKRYWLDLPPVKNQLLSLPSGLSHPLLGKQLNSPLKQIIFQSNIQTETFSWLQDHCLQSQAIFPGAAYLEMAIALGLFQFPNQQLTIKDLEINSPLYLDSIPEIQSILTPNAENTLWEIHSMNHDQQWQLHAKGKVFSLQKTPEKIDLGSLKAQFTNKAINLQQYYLNCQEQGINYGVSFQGIKQLFAQDQQALGLIELPHHLDAQSYHFHPALLDACLQILFAALPPELATTTYIPIGLEQLDLFSFSSTKIWSHLQLKQISSPQIITADVWLYDEQGNLIAQLLGLQSQGIKSTQPETDDWLHHLQWQAQPLLKPSSALNPSTWLILSDQQGIGQQVAQQLRAQQQQCHLIQASDQDLTASAWSDLIQQHSEVTGIIYLGSLDDIDNWQECKSYLFLIQAVIKNLASYPAIYLITRNAQAVNHYQLTSGIRNSALWGMQKAIALEYPEISCTLIDLPVQVTEKDAAYIMQEICATEIEQVAYRHDQRYVARLMPYAKDNQNNDSTNQQLVIQNPGDLDSLQWQSIPRQAPQDEQIEIEVQTTGLNFRDVMVALDLYPDDTKFLGLECAGIVTAVGKNIANYQIGDRIMAISQHSFSQYLALNPLLAIKKPAALNFTEAATIPVTFLTAYYTLVHLAKLQPGEKILIHSAAGGVGLAAIQIAQNIGAEIYATASQPKWELLKSLGIKHIMDSRTLDFAAEIKLATQDQGVDVILNSLAGDFIAQNLTVLNPQGRLIEIGKQDLWSPAKMAQVMPKIDYFIVDLWQLTKEQPKLIQEMLSQISCQFNQGKLKPLLHQVFSQEQTIDAFRYMQQGKHQGKIIIDPSSSCSASQHSKINLSGTYLIAGGMGAIGLKIAQWLIEQGVKNLALIGRQKLQPSSQTDLEQLQQNAKVIYLPADIADSQQLAQALEQIELILPPLSGIIHCAGITCDRTIMQQSWQDFAKVLAPKTQGAWNLHCLTQKYDLAHFILFSSAASLIGSAGQANYCAANAFLDALAHARRSAGLPAISINWGAWSNTGLAANHEITQNLSLQGIGTIKPSTGINFFQQLLLDNPQQVGVVPINWHIWQKYHQQTNFYQHFINKKYSTINLDNDKQQLLNAIPEQRFALLVQQISQQVNQILGLKKSSQIDLDLGFSELGLDSLGAVELRNKIQSNYQLKLSPTIIFDYPNIKEIVQYLLQSIFNDEMLDSPDNHTKNSMKIDNLSEAEAEALLLEELDSLELF